MPFRYFCLFFLILGTFFFSKAIADCNQDSEVINNNHLPVFRTTLTPNLGSDERAMYILAEGGQNNYRLNVTGGFWLNDSNRFKIGGEFLGQRLAYNFKNGRTYRWMQQWAGGVGYQWLVCNDYISSFDLGFEYACARRFQLPTYVCSNNQSVFRRISTGTYLSGSGGFTMFPWGGARLSLAAHYDFLSYRRKFVRNRLTCGYGGTVNFSQQVTEHIGINFKGELRRPYDFVEGKICWTSPSSEGNYNIGFFGNHTWGRNKLSNATAYGIEVNIDLSTKNSSPSDCTNFCGESFYYWHCKDDNDPRPRDLVQWVSIPAVYIPEILAIHDQNKPCTAPTSSSITSQILDNSTSTTFNLALSQFFTSTGPPLTYSATVSSSNASGPLYSYFYVNPTTGYLTLIDSSGKTGSGETLTVNVTASNTCSSTSQTFTIDVF